MEFIDTHCHLHFDAYNADREAVMKASAAAGVKRLICVGCSLDDSLRAIELACKHDGLWATAGAHPHDGQDFLDDSAAATKLQKMLKSPKVVAVGEIGLDYYHQKTSKADQEKILRPQLEVGLEAGLPFVFHVREAWEGFWPIFDSYKGITGVIHSFSANPEQLDNALGRGMHVALNGLMTYTKDESWIESAKKVPLDKLLLETDARY